MQAGFPDSPLVIFTSHERHIQQSTVIYEAQQLFTLMQISTTKYINHESILIQLLGNNTKMKSGIYIISSIKLSKPKLIKTY